MHTRNVIFAALLTVVAAAPAVYLFAEDKAASDTATQAAAKADEQGFKSLFDGKSLDGWEGREGFWSVQDGCITGQTKEAFKGPNTFLVYKGGDVSNFELRFRYKIVGGNSGVQYRSKFLTDNNSDKLFRVGGFQGDFEAGTTFSGILYDEGGVGGGRGIMAQRGEKVTYEADGSKKVEKLSMTSEQLQKAIHQNDWNDYVIIADGDHITHKINGNTTVEVIDKTNKAPKSGLLALQLHAGAPMMVQFKDIRIKQLGGSK
jgi:hypothetical protein